MRKVIAFVGATVLALPLSVSAAQAQSVEVPVDNGGCVRSPINAVGETFCGRTVSVGEAKAAPTRQSRRTRSRSR